jgi:RimJ/RimL family protein N-acetyltransferase
MKTPFIVGKRIYLRPLEREDLNERYTGWLNDRETTRYLETGIFPSTREDLQRFYEGLAGSRDHVLLAIVKRDNDLHIGNLKLGPIYWVHRTATFGILIGDHDCQGKGLGEEATRLAVEYGFFRLNLRKIDLGVYAEHEAAVRCYLKVGFQVEGRAREQLFHEGQYKDRLLMGLLRSEYRPLETGTDQ